MYLSKCSSKTADTCNNITEVQICSYTICQQFLSLSIYIRWSSYCAMCICISSFIIEIVFFHRRLTAPLVALVVLVLQCPHVYQHKNKAVFILTFLTLTATTSLLENLGMREHIKPRNSEWYTIHYTSTLIYQHKDVLFLVTLKKDSILWAFLWSSFHKSTIPELDKTWTYVFQYFTHVITCCFASVKVYLLALGFY